MQHSNQITEETAVLRSTEAARYLGISPAQLRLSRHTGELFKGIAAPPFLKVGSAVRYRKCTLDAWLTALREYGRTSEYRLSGRPNGPGLAAPSSSKIDRSAP